METHVLCSKAAGDWCRLRLITLVSRFSVFGNPEDICTYRWWVSSSVYSILCDIVVVLSIGWWLKLCKMLVSHDHGIPVPYAEPTRQVSDLSHSYHSVTLTRICLDHPSHGSQRSAPLVRNPLRMSVSFKPILLTSCAPCCSLALLGTSVQVLDGFVECHEAQDQASMLW